MKILIYFFGFGGRIGRGSWWLGSVILFLAGIANWAIMVMIDNGPALIPSVLTSFTLFWSSLAIYAKRWHDRDKSGFWTLIILIPVIGLVWVFVECGFLGGTRGRNRYGSKP